MRARALACALGAVLALAPGCEKERASTAKDDDEDRSAGGTGGAEADDPGAGGGARRGGDVARITIGGELPEEEEPLAFLGGGSETLRDVIGRLDAAAHDPSVGTVVLDVRPLAIGWARIFELRGAVDRVRAAGKKTVAYLESGGDRDYVVASGAEEVVMPPAGELMLVGLHVETVFLKELLDGFGVEADFEAIGRYKSAAETITRTEPSPAAREAELALVDDIWAAEVAAIAAGRGLGADAVRAAIDAGPYIATDAVAAGLITRTGYADEVGAAALAALGGGGKLREDYDKKKSELDGDEGNPLALLSTLLSPPEEPRSGEPAVAVLYLTGPISHGGRDGGLFDAAGISSGATLATLEEIAKDEDVKAIVLRVDSPGGSAVASDLIFERLRALGAKKPIIASMGDVAASGGYYVAMAAKKIVAEPATITGSIGVIGGKLVLGKAYAKYGVGSWSASRGAHAGLMSDVRPFSDGERAALRKMMEGTYAAFVAKAAASRGKTPEDIRAVAEGRVWSGVSAKAHGLVDELGGLDDAIALARKEAGLKPDAEVLTFPRPKGLGALFGADALAGARAAAALPAPDLPLPGPVARNLRALRTLLPLFATDRVFALAPLYVF